MAPRQVYRKKLRRLSDPVEQALWGEVQLGPGDLATARRLIIPPDSQYPNATGVSFFKDGVFNRTDPTGPRENSQYHFWPAPELFGGEVLLATWTDLNGAFRSSTYNVPMPLPVDASASGSIQVLGHATVPPTVTPSAWPDATNTGPTGTLTASGSLTVSTNGTTVQNLHITGKLTINASNVTVRNCRITNTTERYVVQIQGGRTGILFEDTEIDGNLYATHGLVFNNYTMRRCNIHRCGDGLHIGPNTTVEDTYVHTLAHNLFYVAAPHYDCVQALGGSNIVLRRNNFVGRFRDQTSAIIMSAFNNNLGNVLIENNRLANGGFTLYLFEDDGTPTWNFVSPGITVRNNIFVRKSSQYGPLGQQGGKPMQPHPLLFFSNNTFDTGDAVFPGMGYDLP